MVISKWVAGFVISAVLSWPSGAAAQKDTVHFSRVFDTLRPYRIYLPAGYYASERRYPVIYFFHGNQGDEKLYYEGLQQLVDSASVILVAWNGRSVQTDLRPYNIGYHSNINYRVQFKDYFPEFVAHIDSTYRTLNDRGHRGLIGHSMGGFMSFYLAGKYPQMVGAAVSSKGSPEFFVGYPQRHTLYQTRFMFKNLYGVRIRFHNGTGTEELHNLNNEVNAGARREEGLDYTYARYDGVHDIGFPEFRDAFRFVVHAFEHPLGRPERFHHADVYPSFNVWGYDVKSDLHAPGYIDLKGVTKGGMGISTRKWEPHGVTIPGVHIEVRTAPVYAPSTRYTVFDYNVKTGVGSDTVVLSDSEGRVGFTVDGQYHQVGIHEAGGAPEIVFSGHRVNDHGIFLVHERPCHLRLRLLNRGGSAARGLRVTLSTPTAGVRIIDPTIGVGDIYGEQALWLPADFRVIAANAPVKDGSPFRVRFNLVIRDSAGDVWRDEFDAPVFYHVPEFRDIGIDDGDSEIFGSGNGNNIAEPGETIMIYQHSHRTRLYYDDPYIDDERLHDDLQPDKWGDGYSLSSLIHISKDCPPGHKIRFLACYEVKEWRTIKRDVTWGTFTITVGGAAVKGRPFSAAIDRQSFSAAIDRRAMLAEPGGDTSRNGLVFASGFEEPNWRSVWDDYDGNPDSTNQGIANPGPFNLPGNHVMRLHVGPGRGGSDLVKVLPHTYDRLYARWYEYWEPGYDFSAPNHGSGLFAGDRKYLGQSDFRPKGDDFATAWFEPDAAHGGRAYLYTYYRGMFMDCANPEGRCWGDHFPCFIGPGYCTDPAYSARPGKMPPLLRTGKWYCIEMMMDMGKAVDNAAAADGVLDLWIDGVEYGPWDKLWFRTVPGLKLSMLSLSTFFHGRHSAEGVLIDDIAVSEHPFSRHVDGQAALVRPGDERLQVNGRVGFHGDIAEIYWPGSSFTIKCAGPEVRAKLKDEHGFNYFNVIVDDSLVRVLRIDTVEKEYVLATGLSARPHTVELAKRADWFRGKTWFYGFGLAPGASVFPMAAPKRRIEFYGNSITVGAAVEDTRGDSGDSTYTNNYASYGAIAARHYHAGYSCIASSGIGLMVSWGSLIMPELYDRLDPADSSSKWDFSKWTPDIVVINLFQNDCGLVNLPGHPQFKRRFGDKAPSEEAIVEAYRKFAGGIRGRYPGAYILCVLGTMDAVRPGSPWPGYIRKAVRGLHDRRVLIHIFPYKNSPGHPKMAEQRKMAEGLIGFIDGNVRW